MPKSELLSCVGQQVTLSPIRINDDGEGVATLEGVTIFVPHLLPGEVANVRVQSAGRSFLRGEMIERLGTESKDRVHPPCSVFGQCGGCQLQHLSYRGQLLHKQKVVEHHLRRSLRGLTAIENLQVQPTIASPSPYGYRNHVQIPVRYDGQKDKLLFGFYAPSSHELVPTEDCWLISPRLMLLWQVVRKGMETWPRELKAAIHHLHLREAVATGQQMIIWAVQAEYEKVVEHIQNFYQNLESSLRKLLTVGINRTSHETDRPNSRRADILAGSSWIEEELLGVRFRLSAESFFQVNSAQAEQLYRHVIDRLQKHSATRLLDAYSGTGTLSLLLSPYAKTVVGVESVRASVENARQNAEINHIFNVQFIEDTVEHWLPRQISDNDSFDTILVDPPRKGLHSEVISAILKANPQTFLYVSCNPVTLARDLRPFAENGYQITSVQPFDMFPQTSHVECVVATYRVGK
ncbi:23S rRNA (uracil(1939)-C(5))-methyltransferase RlmD [Alicyclobacillus tolerans]|uniref:23S rRNA (Uracil1939-C5)-methyltransferase n=1 Tax=Alicyclobacillus tolerans TaxID=90970 RepID=A0ABT9LZG0_9BACL|nr:23S rRNA (uracil(1939)-C(5))-methyltransferase RlmD [Alicyclobacillus tengchongensis]MDP9729669.1 23S rRNA (uracil1939-C5)-methyltransferase [Alicyclobacillus tengchongensis]